MSPTIIPTAADLSAFAHAYWAARAAWIEDHRQADDGRIKASSLIYFTAQDQLRDAILAARPAAESDPEPADIFEVLSSMRIDDHQFLIGPDPTDPDGGLAIVPVKLDRLA